MTFPDGRAVAGVAWKTTPIELALAISKGLADSTVIAKVNGEVWDLDRPFEGDATVEFLKFEDKEAEVRAVFFFFFSPPFPSPSLLLPQAVFWHSSAHVLGEAMEQHYGCCLCYGPPIENGFYYDMHLTAEQQAQGSVTPDDFPGLTKLCEEATGQKQLFQRLEMTKADLLEMFRYNEFKCRILNERCVRVERPLILYPRFRLMTRATQRRHADDDGVPLRPAHRLVPGPARARHGQDQGH